MDRWAPVCRAASRPVADARGAQRVAARPGRLRSVQAEVPRQELTWPAARAARPGSRAARRRARRVVDRRRSSARAIRSPVPTPSSTAGWIIPGLVDAHCHVGLGPHGPVGLDEAIAQAETERDAGALLLRDCGSPTDTRSSGRSPRSAPDHQGGKASRAAQALHARTTPSSSRTSGSCPDAVAEQARRGDGWVKLVGDWIDRSVGDLAPLWSDDVLVAAIAAAHAEGARVTAHVFGEDALPGLINAGIDCIEHGTGLTEDTVALMAERGTALVPTLINIENFPGFADAATRFPVVRRTYARPLCPLPPADRGRTGGRRADLRRHRRRRNHRARVDRRRGGRARRASG